MFLIAFVLTMPVGAEELAVLPAEEHANWQAVGRINSAGYRKRDMCSGVLIAPDQVLTAAHCVAEPDGTLAQPADFTFVAGWLRGEAADAVTVKSIWVHPDAYATGGLNIRYDIALLALERTAAVAPLPILKASGDAPFGIVGYSTKRPHMLGAAFNCESEERANILQLNCAVLPGNSGSPVLTQTSDGWSVTAIVSAMGRNGALAVPVSRLD